ncbi:MAG: hypothetical protein K2Q24_10050 [Chitinophagaceae bacterium]|jgi:hypothetical protein|nr:hypothetical protein [Chitinophagaceae bacterium]
MMGYSQIYESTSGGYVWLHSRHGQDELHQNLEACRILADHGYKIEMLPTFSAFEVELRKEFLEDVFEYKNPDIRINQLHITDIKTPDKIRAIKQATINRCIYSCAQQKVKIAVLNLAGQEYAIQDIKKGIIGALQPDRNKSIEEVWVITKQQNLFIAKRTMVFDETIYEILDTL